jgi:hypothetical protein
MVAAPGDAGGPYERVTKDRPKHFPPCDERCWEKVGIYTFVYTKPANLCCRWDETNKKWTECVREEGTGQ